MKCLEVRILTVSIKKDRTSSIRCLKILLANPEPQVIQYTYLNKHGAIMFLETTGRNLLNDPAITGLNAQHQ
jgi:hypothetical protein